MSASAGSAPEQLRFLHGGGQMGAYMRAHDWTRSALGPTAGWSAPLRTAVRIMLNTGHPMYIFWGDTHACLYNDAYSLSIGPERHPGSLGMPGKEVWAEIWDIIGPQVDRVMSGGGATWHVNHLVPITRHGKREDVYWTYSYSPIDDDGAATGVGGVLVVCTETTEQVLTAQRAQSERDRLAGLFEQAPTFMALLRGAEHRFELCNPAYLQLVGHREVLGKTVAEALPEAAEQGYLRLLDEVFASGKAFRALGAKIALRPRPGEAAAERYVDFVYQPIRDAAGRVTGIFVQGADVTERSQAEEALKVANRAKDEFLAILGHELRNPLAPITTALQLMRLRSEAASERERAVIERQVEHLKRLVDDLLDVSRVTSGKIELRRERVELAEVVASAIELVSPLIEARQQELRTSIAPRGLAIDGDRTRLVQVVSNLLSNAAKYGRDQGMIEIRGRVEASDVVLSVVDDGMGIAADLLPRVFELFTQGERSADRPQGGLGLGLAIVRSLVGLHGGSVSATSAGTGAGSEFEVRLPAADSAADRSGGVSSASTTATQAARRVLVVDDNRDAADLLAQALRVLGHEVRAAYDGPGALEAVRGFTPEVALLDIGLPVMDGYELARRLKGLDGRGALRLVAITGYGQETDRRRAEAAGFDEHLVKPVDPSRVASVIQHLTGQP